jgi:hypothetical protein
MHTAKEKAKATQVVRQILALMKLASIQKSKKMGPALERFVAP